MDMLAATEFLARSSTQTSVGWIGYIIIGAIAGWIAGKIVKGSGSGILMNIVIGIVGALIGGFLLSFFLDTAGGGWWFTLFTAVLGSVILLWIVGLVTRKKVSAPYPARWRRAQVDACHTSAAANAPMPLSDQCSAMGAIRLPLRRRSQVNTNPAAAGGDHGADDTGHHAEHTATEHAGEPDIAAGESERAGDVPEAEQQ